MADVPFSGSGAILRWVIDLDIVKYFVLVECTGSIDDIVVNIGNPTQYACISER
jgi:hypothetical protein